MILKVAWRNVWRNATRTLVVIGAVIVAIWSLVFMMSFVRGMVHGYIENAIQYETSHIQVHNPHYLKENLLENSIASGLDVGERISSLAEVHVVSPRILVSAMIGSAKGARGIVLHGVQPIPEGQLTHLADKLQAGEWLAATERPGIVVSRIVADKLSVGTGKKVVVTFQGSTGEITSAAFRIRGIYSTQSRRLDEMAAFVDYDQLQSLTSLPAGALHEIALNVRDVTRVDSVATELQQMFPELSVQTYEEISPDLALFKSQVNINMLVMTTIIMLALIFGIINTMLMAVLERTRELGMLMAIGMNKQRVFSMVVVETAYVSLVGAFPGMALGWLTVKLLSRTGIDLSMWASGLSQFGMATLIRPELNGKSYVIIAIAMCLMALLASIYPALKAIRLRPVSALRKI